ncbi:MAG: DUF460 domain-containing protein [Candidatus Aenigmatarchaeota archaeon]
MEPKPVIVGIDTGATTAVAVLDLRRNLLGSTSKKEFSAAAVREFISAFGRPLFIATDKAKPPLAAKKLAASFNCGLWCPERDLGVSEKNEATKAFTVANAHERDAVAAAIFSHKAVAGQFSRIDDTLRQLGFQQFSDIVKTAIARKEVSNIAEAVKKLTARTEKPLPPRPVTDEVMELRRQLAASKHSYEILQAYVNKLEARLKTVEKQRAQLLAERLAANEEARRKVIREKEIFKRDIALRHLTEEVAKLREQVKKLEAQGAKPAELQQIRADASVPVVPIADFTKEAITAAGKEFGLANEILWIKNYRPSNSTAKFLIGFRPRTLIFPQEPAELEMFKTANIAVVWGLKPQQRRWWGAVQQKELWHALKESERKGFLDWLASYKQR